MNHGYESLSRSSSGIPRALAPVMVNQEEEPGVKDLRLVSATRWTVWGTAAASH